LTQRKGGRGGDAGRVAQVQQSAHDAETCRHILQQKSKDLKVAGGGQKIAKTSKQVNKKENEDQGAEMRESLGKEKSSNEVRCLHG